MKFSAARTPFLCALILSTKFLSYFCAIYAVVNCLYGFELVTTVIELFVMLTALSTDLIMHSMTELLVAAQTCQVMI